MKDEIKEILYGLNDIFQLSELDQQVKDIEKVFDYITNLQEELEEEKRIEQEDLKTIQNLEEENERLSVELNKNMIERNNYLSRNEKAIEYIGNGNIGIPRKTRDKFIAILKGEGKDVKD